MFGRVRRVIVVLLALIGLLTISGGVWLGLQGIGARKQPGRIETAVSRALRSAAIPENAKRLANPVAATPDVLAEGMEHFADHCAPCHGNAGNGDTPLGRGMYPRPPDMRLTPTQQLSDGELFYIIENGVKLTGMPAFGDGTGESTAESWALVHFVRRLPQLTPNQVQRMATMNPRTNGEWRQMEEERAFLEGRTSAPPIAPARHKHGGK
jgi:mono/diheme cytochrome c family protein